MSVKFVQDVEVTSGKIELTNQTANEIVCSGNLDLISDDNTNDTLDIGTTTQSWKGVNINTGSLAVREQSGSGFVTMTPSTNLVYVGTGGGYKIQSGTSSQFLKADGSVDTTTYATGTIPTATSDLTNDSGFLTDASDFVTLSGGSQTIAGDKTFTGTTKFGTFGNLNTSTDVGMQFELGTTALNTMRTDADAFRIYFGGTSSNGEALKILQTGEMTLKTQGTTEYKWDLDGDFHADGDVIAYSTTVSDRNLKENINTIENATETVKKLRGVQYEWKQGSGKREGQTEIGVIAQEVEEVLPFLVREKTIKDKKVKTVDYEKMIGLLIESNKELSDRLDKLEGCSCKK